MIFAFLMESKCPTMGVKTRAFLGIGLASKGAGHRISRGNDWPQDLRDDCQDTNGTCTTARALVSLVQPCSKV